MGLTLHNIDHEPKRKPGNPAWVKGRSGNPKGVALQANHENMRDLCRAQTKEAIHTLIKLMRFKGPHQFAAATAILDRAWGKPTQHIETSGNSVLELHLIAARAVSEALTTIEHEAQPEDVNAKQPVTLEIPTE
ncbi:MAG TPA: hypothetical protein VNO55_19855 [Polyangia bacterium]|nr:hypothetical protein [Polyangia bacterium]